MDKEDFFARYEELGETPEEVILNPVIRVNTLKISEKDLIARLKKVKLRKIDFLEHGYEILDAPFSLGASIEYLLGYYYLHEAASQLAVSVLGKGEKILDMAASPGGKTTQIGMLMENKSVLIACDKGRRIEKLRNNLERMGVQALVYKKDARYVKDFGIEFDKILLDAPCSRNFVVDDQWFTHRNVADFQENAQIQKELLEAGFGVLKKGGELVYSTSSLEPEENEMVVDWALEHFAVELVAIDCIGDSGLTEVFGKQLHKEIKKCRRLWPWKTKTQGFFIAKFRKC